MNILSIRNNKGNGLYSFEHNLLRHHYTYLLVIQLYRDNVKSSYRLFLVVAINKWYQNLLIHVGSVPVSSHTFDYNTHIKATTYKALCNVIGHACCTGYS